MIGTALAVTAFVWSYAVTCTSIYGAGRAAWKRLRYKARRVDPQTRVLVVRPCAGSEPCLDRALLSIATAHSSARLLCRLAVGSPEDGASPHAWRAAELLYAGGLDAKIVFTHADAPNHKAAQIEAVLALEGDSFDALVIADSDIDLDGFDLDALVAPLFTAGSAVDAVWAPPVETGALRGSGDRASKALLSSSLHAFTLLGSLDSASLVGKLFAVRRDAIRAIGGFAVLTHVLGEDMELSRRLRLAGRTVRVAPIVARSLQTGRSWQSAVERYARWLTVIRAQRPWLLASYPLLFLAAPFLFAAAALLSAASPRLALATGLFALVSRLFVAFSARALAGEKLSCTGALAGAALADALLAVAFVRALASRTLTWRGRALAIERGGSLTAKDQKAA